MILNLDHLEDSSLEVLLHELRKAEEAIGAGERSPEAIENAAKLARAAEWKSPNGGTVASAGGGGGARTRRARRRRQPRRGRRTRRHLLHHVVASREETSAWRYFHVRHTLFCTTLVETSPRVSARQSIFAFLSNSAARRDRFSAATLAAFLAAPALCVRLFLARYFSPKCAARPIPAATYTLVIHPDSRANSSASAALPPAPFFFDLVERDDPDAPAFALVAEAGGAPRNTIRRPRRHGRRR